MEPKGTPFWKEPPTSYEILKRALQETQLSDFDQTFLRTVGMTWSSK